MKRFLACSLITIFSLLAPPPAAGESLKIGLLPIVDTLLLHVAQQEGHFSREGLEVELIVFQSALEKDAAVQAGALDGHFCELSSVIVQRAAGLAFTVVASTSHTNPEGRMFGLVTSPASTAENLDDLEGRSLAVARQTIVDFLGDVFLSRAGKNLDFMTRKDIRKIPVRLQMLLAGQVEAAVFPEPLLSIAEQAGGRVLADDRGLDMPLAVVALAEHRCDPQTVESFRRALSRAGETINADPGQYRALLLSLRLIPPRLADSFVIPPVPLSKVPHTLPSEDLFQAYVNWLVRGGVLAAPGSTARAGRPPVPAYTEVIWAAPGFEAVR